MPNSAARNTSTRPSPPPSRRSTSASCRAGVQDVPMPWAIPPKSSADDREARSSSRAAHRGAAATPARTGRRATGRPTPGRAGPASRPARQVAARRQRERDADQDGAHHDGRARAPTTARRRTAGPVQAQPIGDSHDSHVAAPGVARRRRSRNATPSTARPMPRAARAPSVSCAATRADRGEQDADERPGRGPARRSPPAGSPWLIMPSAASDPAAISTSAPTTTASAAASPRVPADHGGAEQLAPPGLLLGTGVPDDRQHAHQRDDHGR